MGIDVGLKTFATLSAGVEIANPRFFRQEEQALARTQHRLSKEEKGTPAHAPNGAKSWPVSMSVSPGGGAISLTSTAAALLTVMT